nr:MAG TPA: hypothetical protein [Caudoviricetes sp.]DAX11081.1 MAG TPA: hypothetical protein [Caudoviricetes sp.]
MMYRRDGAKRCEQKLKRQSRQRKGHLWMPLLNWYKINLGIHYNIVRKLRKE